MNRKEELTKRLEELKKKASDEQSELVQELAVIEENERYEREREKLRKAILVMDNRELFLSLMDHTRTSCSDDNLSNGRTTPGRGGNIRCVKCGFMKAAKEYDTMEEDIKQGIEDGWYEYNELVSDLGGYYISVDMCRGLEITVTVDSRDDDWYN